MGKRPDGLGDAQAAPFSSFATAAYRVRATIRERWAGYLAIVLLIGSIGGLAMGSIAGARRTQSSYPTFLKSTNPSDLTVSIYEPDGATAPSLQPKIARLAGVKSVRAVEAPSVAALSASGAPELQELSNAVPIGSTDGEFYRQDRLAVIEGRLANPGRADEFMATASAAQILGYHVGEVVPVGFYSTAEKAAPNFGSSAIPPKFRLKARLVGIVVLSNQLLQDDIDRAYGFVFVTPALMRRAIAADPAAAEPVSYDVSLDHPADGLATVEREIIGIVPPQLIYQFHATGPVVAEVELSVKPESLALGFFGAIVALVCLVVAVQAAARQLQVAQDEAGVLRALGASPAAVVGDALIGIIAATVLGAVLAVAVAIALSPLTPIGPVRPVYPDGGLAFDWTVLGVGFAVLVVALGGAATLLAVRGAPHRALRRGAVVARASTVARGVERTGVPVAGALGVRLALESGRGRTAVPVRAVLVGTVLAVTVVVGTLTFASGFSTLVSHPALYGWNWNYVLNASNDVPPATFTALARDHDVASFSGYSYSNAQIDNVNVPILVTDANPPVAPPILSGRGLQTNRDIVLGAETLALLHVHVGETVTVSYGTPSSGALYISPRKLTVVGTATFPAVGFASIVADHTSMGVGALLPNGSLPASFLNLLNGGSDPNLNGPALVFVRLRGGLGAGAGLANLQHIAAGANRVFARDPNPGARSNNVTVIGVQRPAQIVNYRSVGSIPVFLAAGLAAGAIAALGLTLVVSVRRRRRDLALLKALGITPRQLAATVAVQSTVAALIGMVIGLPLGIIVGRQLWSLFARNISAVPDATVPVLSVALVALGTLVFANLVAAIPGRVAARTPTALVLRAE